MGLRLGTLLERRQKEMQFAAMEQAVNSGQAQGADLWKLASQNYLAMQQGTKNNPTLTPSGPYGHGNGGLWSVPGQDRQVFNAMQYPLPGLLSKLSVRYDGRDSEFGGYSSPLMTILTGVTKGNLDTVSNQPTAQCDPGPEGGLKKVGTMVVPYGQYSGSVSLNLDKATTLRDIADPTYLQLVGNPQAGNQFIQPTSTNFQQSITKNELHERLFESGTSFTRMLNERLYIGDPTNSAGSDNWKDIQGLDIFINSGNKRDAFTSNVLTAANSVIVPFGNQQIASGPQDIWRNIDSTWYQLDWISRQEGFGEWEGLISIHPMLFNELTEIAPVKQYYAFLTAIGQYTNGRVNFSGTELMNMQMDMRSNLYLPIRGKKIPVVLDDSIPETDVTNNAALSAGQFASDIRFVNTSVMGGIETTYIQAFNQANAMADAITTAGRLGAFTYTSDGGLYRWYVRANGPCFQWDYKMRFRLMVHCTQLCARITNVAYAPLQHIRSSDPDSTYFANGGRTNAPQDSFYVSWTSSPQIIS